jgi:hypothetical protein
MGHFVSELIIGKLMPYKTEINISDKCVFTEGRDLANAFREIAWQERKKCTTLSTSW